MQQININVLKPHPQNNEFFDDLSGEEFERLKNSIRDEKIYTDILVSPDMTIISGHQRVRAAKELGMTLVPIKIDEDLQDENSKLRALISNNFGRRKNDPTKDRKAIDTYVKLKGYKHGGDRQARCQSGTMLTLDDIAKELNTSKRNLQRALRIERNLTDSMKELLDNGTISQTLASDTIASLSEEEQEQLISSLNTTKKITQREVQKYIDEIKELKSNPPKPDDYDSTKRQLQNYKTDYQKLKLQFENKVLELQTEKNMLERKVKLNQEDSERFNKLKADIELLTKQKDDLSRRINSATELAGLTVRLEKLLEEELAPIKFKRCIEVLDSSDICVENLLDIINRIDRWSDEIRKLLSNKCDYVIDVQ